MTAAEQVRASKARATRQEVPAGAPEVAASRCCLGFVASAVPKTFRSRPAGVESQGLLLAGDK